MATEPVTWLGCPAEGPRWRWPARKVPVGEEEGLHHAGQLLQADRVVLRHYDNDDDDADDNDDDDDDDVDGLRVSLGRPES